MATIKGEDTLTPPVAKWLRKVAELSEESEREGVRVLAVVFEVPAFFRRKVKASA